MQRNTTDGIKGDIRRAEPLCHPLTTDTAISNCQTQFPAMAKWMASGNDNSIVHANE